MAIMPEPVDQHATAQQPAGRVWTAPSFRLHRLAPEGGTVARRGENTTTYSYRPS